MKVKFWGVRGSIPTPLTSNDVRQRLINALKGATPADLADEKAIESYVDGLPLYIQGTFGGETACIEVWVSGGLLILDAGSGLRRFGLDLIQTEFGRGLGEAHLFLSHTHLDHLIGFPFFAPAFIKGNKFYICGVHDDIEGRFRGLQSPEYFPVPFEAMGATFGFVQLKEGDNGIFRGAKISTIKVDHPGGCYAYRIEENGKVLIYATDAEYKESRSDYWAHYVQFYQGADVLIFDAQYTLEEAKAKEDWGHSSAVTAVDIAVEAGVKKVVLFHHEPTYSDEKVNEILGGILRSLRRLPSSVRCEMMVGYEGLEIEL